MSYSRATTSSSFSATFSPLGGGARAPAATNAQPMNVEDYAGRPIPLELQKAISDTPNLGTLMNITINRDVQKMLFDLFQTLNKSHSGKLQWSDFENVSSSIPKWHEIRSKLDFNQDGEIDFKEFVYGISQMALNKTPSSLTVKTQASLEEWFDMLALKTNEAIVEMCQELCQFITRR